MYHIHCYVITNTNSDSLSRSPNHITTINYVDTNEPFNDYVKFYSNALNPTIFDFNETNEKHFQIQRFDRLLIRLQSISMTVIFSNLPNKF